jgi:hypothetical protein
MLTKKICFACYRECFTKAGMVLNKKQLKKFNNTWAQGYCYCDPFDFYGLRDTTGLVRIDSTVFDCPYVLEQTVNSKT